MAPKITATLANNQADEVLALIDAGSGAGLIRFYSGTQPATADTALSGNTLIATLTCSDPAGTTSGGVLTFSSITADSSADNSGTISFARLVDSDGNTVADYTVTATGGGGDIELSSVSVSAGDEVSLSSLTHTVPTS